MAKLVVKYLLEGQGTVPAAIQDGGYWPVGHELVGVTYDNTERYVSSSFASMNKADLVARLAGMNMKDPNDNSPLSSDQQLAMLDAWLAQVGMSDLA